MWENNKLKTSTYNSVSSLIREIVAANKLQGKLLRSSLEMSCERSLKDFEAYVDHCLKNGQNIKYLSECYGLIIRATLREQVYFKRHNVYRYSRFDEVSRSVYFDDDYMNRYMTGLALTSFLWPNHIAMRSFFREKLPKDISGSYLEIGPGHGFYMMMAMRDTSYSHFLGIDISPASVDLTNRILCDSTFGSFCSYEIVERDFLKWSTNQRFDAVVMGEVLEHVENPIDFLERIHEFANEKAFIYITTAINAPAVDHIYLYRSEDEVEEQIISTGFRIKERLVSPYFGTTLEESKENNLPINIALVLEKNN